jgi:hypothetical protein
VAQVVQPEILQSGILQRVCPAPAQILERLRWFVHFDAEHKTKASVRDLAKRELEPLNRNVAEPLSITKLSDFVDRVYLPFAKQQKRPSTYRGYSQVSDYLKTRCQSEWLREVKTHHVQS